MKRNKLIRIIIALLILLILLPVGIYLFYMYIPQKLTVSKYTVEAEIESNLRIVQLTDLHNSVHGKQNQKLVLLVEEQKPDIIVMTGDMINRDDENTEVIVSLIKELTKIAPVYYGYGNHENTWEENWGKSLSELLEAAGAVVLEQEYTNLTVNGSVIRIGGFSGYYGFPGFNGHTGESEATENAFYAAFEDTDNYKILLNHIPTQWTFWNYIDNCNQDLILSGHYHGGQWVLPKVGAVYAPYEGFFPEKVRGCFTGSCATCIISSGLGNEYAHIPRVNNPPEIVLIDVEAKGQQ